MLRCYRVLDLTNEKGFLCGRALGDLGADVIKIEKPGGEPSRNIGPFYHDIPHPEKSLYWFAFNTNKRGITLDIEKADGREIFKKLVKTADVVVESFATGYMEKLGLGYEALSQVNPDIVMTSVSGFGREGPYKDYNDHDIAVWAMSGFMYIAGEPDRPPLAPSYSHGHLIGAMNAAIGTMVALCQRNLTGEGQYVDASTHQSLCTATSAELKLSWGMQKIKPTRKGRKRSHIIAIDGEIDIPLLWECKDGSVSFAVGFGPTYAGSNSALVEWIKSDGIDPGILARCDWLHKDWTYYTVADIKEAERVLTSFFKKHTREELGRASLERRIHLAIVLTTKDQLVLPQLIARNFWTEVEHPELGTKITYPGAFARPGEGTCGIRFRAPLIGEHNNEIYQEELGMTTEELVAYKQARVI